MKTAEEAILKILEKYIHPMTDAIEPHSFKKLSEELKQFRKEGMKEAWKHSYYECGAEIQRGDWVVAQGSGTLEENFEEWYNENKE